MNNSVLSLIATLSLCWSANATAQGASRDYCQWEKFSASCGSDAVVVMEQAIYGRMEFGRCIQFNLGYIGCSSDVLDIADMSCSGRRRCEIGVPSEHLDSVKPCLSELKSYLTASYRCQKVITADALMCRSTNLVKVLPSSGFLSNLVPGSRAGLPSADCGGDSSPHWLIEAQPGQHINVTLWDFSRRSPVTSDSHFASLPGCIKYATLTEVGPEMPSGAAARTKSVCGSGGVESGRVRHVYMSAGSAIQVQIHAISPADGLSAATTPHFLLEYHTVGCADPVLPGQARFIRQGDTATVGCHSSSGVGSTWKLTCNGTTWIGDTQSISACQPESSNQVLNNFQFPVATSVVVIVSLSLLIGFIILSIGLLYMCRRWRRHANDVEETAGCRRIGDGHTEGAYTGGVSRLLVQHKAFGQLSLGTQDQRPDDNMTPSSRQVHRESNEYASIWEWPLPNAPVSAPGDAMMQAGCSSGSNRTDCELPGSRDTHGYYGTYETRQFNSTSELSCRRVEHPYQHPGTPSSGRRCIVKDDASSDKLAGRQRYFELNTSNGLDSSSLIGCPVDVMSGAQTGGVSGPVVMAVHGGRVPCYTQQYDIMAKQSSAAKQSTFLS